MFNVTCDICGESLNRPGALVFSPPDSHGNTMKRHVCVGCWQTHSSVAEIISEACDEPNGQSPITDAGEQARAILGGYDGPTPGGRPVYVESGGSFTPEPDDQIEEINTTYYTITIPEMAEQTFDLLDRTNGLPTCLEPYRRSQRVQGPVVVHVEILHRDLVETNHALADYYLGLGAYAGLCVPFNRVPYSWVTRPTNPIEKR